MFFKGMIISISLVFISACGNSEKEARTLFNQAIQDWQAGDIAAAEDKFDTIETTFLDTKTATEALSKRADLEAQYRSEYDVQQAKRMNIGIFSRKVVVGIDQYLKKNGHYPENLTQIKVNKYQKYLAQCDYKKGFFEAGYQLNCVKADKAVRTDKLGVSAKRSMDKKANKKVSSLDDFGKANTTWGEKFNPTNSVPDTGFYAFYFNTNHPEQVIKKEVVDDVSINYAWDKFHKIKSEDFGGYWVGRINLSQRQLKTIAISQSWAKSRVIIDGHIIYEGGSSHELSVMLEKGSHLIEVEYVNNWHTTEFSVALLDKLEKLSFAEIKANLTANISEEYQTYYAGVYESASKDLSVALEVQKTSKPIVLVLSSHSAVKWHIANPYAVNIRAIVYGSYKPGTSVSGDLASSTLIMPSQKRIGSYRSEKNCRCAGGRYHCEGGSLLSTKNAVEKFTQYPLIGFTGEYSASTLRVPLVTIDELYLEELAANKDKISQARATCTNKSDPNFENMFKK